jgi:sugar phosphate isomerase/epimerase
MHTPMRRRQFLQTAGAAALAATSLARPEPASAAPASGDGTQKARLLPGCCAYSYHDELKAGRMSMEDFILKGAELGVAAVDMTVYWLKSTDPVYLAGLRHLAFKNGLPFSGAACGASMVEPDKAKRAAVLDDIRKWIAVTNMLGAPHLRIFAGALPKGDFTVAQGIDWTVELMKPASDVAAEHGITLGLEDHDGITQTAETTLEILHRVGSPFAGVNLDISNFVASSDEDQYRQIEACVPFATHTHIRDRFGDSHHPIDLDRVWKLFVQGGYRGYMSAEYEGEESAVTAVPKLVDRIKALCAKYSTA